MNSNETLILKSYEVSEINISSDTQIVNFVLTDETKIHMKINENRRIEVLCMNPKQSLLVKPQAQCVIEIFPELDENFYSGEKPSYFYLDDKKKNKKKKKGINKKADPYGITYSKMTEKK